MQSTFLNAHRALQRGVTPEVEIAWLFKIAHNVCLTRRRSSHRRGRIEAASDLQSMQDVIPAPQRESTDELMGLSDALAGMPENQRRAILLREWQGLSYREIADELQLSQSAVETLIFRARRSLAANLEAAEPERRGLVARARAAVDVGTLLAALKTLFGGGAAVKAAAAAVAVSSAAVVASAPVTSTDGPSATAQQSPVVVSAPRAAPAESRSPVVDRVPSVGRPPATAAKKAVAVEAPDATARAGVTPEPTAPVSEPVATPPAVVASEPPSADDAKQKVDPPRAPSAHLPKPEKTEKPPKHESVAPPAAVVPTPSAVAATPSDAGPPAVPSEQSAKSEEKKDKEHGSGNGNGNG